jgi:hypothetical protein
MPGYVATSSTAQISAPNGQQDAPYKSNPPQYGTKLQLIDEPYNMPRLSPKEVVKSIQEVVSTFLW